MKTNKTMLTILTLCCAAGMYAALNAGHITGTVAFLLTGILPWPFKQKNTCAFLGLLLVALTPVSPLFVIGLLVPLYVGMARLQSVPVPLTRQDLTDLRKAAEQSRETAAMGNVRVTGTGATYVVDKNGSWRRIKTQA